MHYRLDSFLWEEWDGRRPRSGRKLLDETGPVHVIGTTAHFISTSVRLRAELLGGSPDYDGQTMGGEPVDSVTDYKGWEIGAAYAQGFRHDFWDELQFLAGATIRAWDRDINDSVTAGGTPVTGYLEEWFILSAELGVRLGHVTVAEGLMWMELLMSVHVYRDEYISLFGISLEPGDFLQFPGGFDFRFGYRTANGLELALTYGLALYNESDPVVVWPYAYYQPASLMQRVGMQVGWVKRF
jgi:hypothetical protein